MKEMIEKVKGALRVCVSEEEPCDACAYQQEGDCIDSRNRNALEVITLLEEENKELREANERLLEKLKDAQELGQKGVPPMPCQIGDVLWVVYEGTNEGICVEKMICKELQFDGKVWSVGEGDGVFYEVDKEVVWTSIELACKEVERRLEAYRNDG